MKMDDGLDTGDILTQDVTEIQESDNAQTLHDRLAQLGAALLRKTVPAFVAGQIVPRPQEEQHASYAPKITKENGRLDWHQPARVLWNRVRAFTPWPGSFTFLPDVERTVLIKVWEAAVSETQGTDPGAILAADKHGLLVACKTGSLRILKLQREGGRPMGAGEFLSGHPLRPGDRLISTESRTS